ncbi:MAG TPA: acetolactate synthase AlsS [Terriglobia bacterium]|jgi:acetolactate synthase-1/2/3 large subunit|nr:acetolactate synthase AlsS [Terriglobia bacterium]
MSTTVTKPAPQTGAGLLVKSLEAQGVEYIFGVPGAKIDKVFDTLLDSKIKTVVCRHEQNAAFIAGGIGRMTEKAGVALVTSGPGCSNLVTGLATANSEGDPVVAIGGAVPVADRLKQLHQSMDTVSLFRPVTKFSAEIDSPDSVSEVIANAFRAAESGRPGAAFISAPKDIMMGRADGEVLTPAAPQIFGSADADAIAAATRLISSAKRPVLLLGLLASEKSTAEAVRGLLAKTKLPVVCTYQGAGVVPREHFDRFGGRIGLFHTQPADKLLDAADVVVTVGYDPIEYEPDLWNQGKKRNLIHIDIVPADIDNNYRPQLELTGNIAATLRALAAQLVPQTVAADTALLSEVGRDRAIFAERAAAFDGVPIHPLRLSHELQALLSDDMTLCLDMGSFHIWLARHLYSFRPRQILMTNGQQTLGVGLPWAIAACLVRPNEKVISISGDGGFLFSAMELETAVRLKCNLVHLVWIDGFYDMVGIQQMAKYGRLSGVEIGPVDVVRFAEAFGAKGLRIEAPDEISSTIKKALAMQGPVVIGVPVDYRDNHRLMEIVRPDALN